MINLQYNPYNKKSICLYNFSIIGNNSDETISPTYGNTDELIIYLADAIDNSHSFSGSEIEKNEFTDKVMWDLSRNQPKLGECYHFFQYLKPLIPVKPMQTTGDFDNETVTPDDHGLHITISHLNLND